MTKMIYGVLGHPVGHSLSPAMQNAAFKAAGIDAEYGVYDVAPEGLEDFLSNLSRKGISGLNVTIPHKIKTKEYIEQNGSLDSFARKLGAVNTVKPGPDGKLCAFNTDGPGFYRSLVEDLKFEPEGKSVFVLGSGGAATAVVMYLGNGPKRIFISDVDEEKTTALKKHYDGYYDRSRISIVDPMKMEKDLDASDLLVNATPIGMKDGDPSPIVKDMLHKGLRVYDLVYNRPATELVRDATRLKLHAVTGLGMLLYQGAIAFEIWTGRPAPVTVMKKALKEALKVNG
ncbi:MAG: shikimate dehydrogenase [Candidatus Omnitrophica bacterium]|nr:shikimate dehydrogenase [Candidatus Omnitrophota bacterium]